MPGAEMEMPAFPVIRFGWRLVSGILVAITSLLLMVMFTAPELEVNEIEVHGLQRITTADVIAVLNTTGTRIYEFDPLAATLALQSAFPELREIQVKMGLPANIAVSAIERVPAFIWKDGDKTMWIDAEGYLFTPRGEIDTLLTIEADSLPLIKVPLSPQPADLQPERLSKITGEEGTVKPKKIKIVDPKILVVANRLSQELPPDTVLTYNEQNGLGWNAHEGWYVFVGRDLNNLDVKLAVYHHIAETLREKEERPGLINVANINAPYYRLEQ
jgi:cell division protein FtsQ